MIWLTRILVGFVALEHFFFLILEVFLWKSPLGRRIFKTTPEVAAQTAPLAVNQGIYNGFLAAGLVFAAWRGDPATVLFFLGCVIVAAIVGAVTANLRILFVQGLPAALAIAAMLLTR
jgi:putative membrane protein